MCDYGQHVGGGADVVAEGACLYLRDGEYGNCLGAVGGDHGKFGMDEWVWHACL